MRNYIASIIILFMVTAASAQQIEPTPALTYNDYLKKSSRQKTTAWVLTATGTAGLLTTLIADASQALGGAFVTVISIGTVEPEYKSYTGYYLLSTLALAGGVTYFISAGKNKGRARALQTTFKMEHAPVLQVNGIKEQSFPSLGIFLSL